jgi:hypothetical protein
MRHSLKLWKQEELLPYFSKRHFYPVFFIDIVVKLGGWGGIREGGRLFPGK